MLNAQQILQLLNNGDPISINRVKDICKQEIIESTALQTGGKSLLQRTKAAQIFLARVPPAHIKACGARFQEHDGVEFQMFNSSYAAFMLVDELDGLIQATEEPHDVLWQFLNNSIDDRVEVKIDIKGIAAQIKLERAEGFPQRSSSKSVLRVPINIGKSCYNAEYLLECYEILGGNIKFYQREDNYRKPAILVSENGKGLLMPVEPRQ